MPAFTAKNYHISRAPKRIELLGDKTKKAESAQHVIEFPGGAIEVSRTSDGHYWAHIILNTGQAYGDEQGLVSRQGRVIDSRFATAEGVFDLPQAPGICQIAVLIETVQP